MSARTAVRHVPVWTALVGLSLALVACGGSPQLPAAQTDPSVQAEAQGTPGSLDKTFGKNGRVTIQVDGANMTPTALQALPGGKLLVGGFSYYSSVGSEFALARLLPGGTPDPAWNAGKTVTTQLARRDSLQGVDVQPDGKVVAVGNANSQVGLVRYTASGTLDPSFGSGGTEVLSLSSNPDAYSDGYGVQALASGKLLVAGDTDGKFFVARLMPSGALDPSFGSGGVVLIDAGTPVEVFAVGFRNGAVVLAGSAANNTAKVARVLNSGSLDTNFSSDGLADITFSAPVQGGALAIQSDDRILLAANDPDGHASVVRVRENGTPDPNFGAGGTISQPFGQATGEVYGLAIQPDDDRIVVGGATLTNGLGDGYSLARYRMNGALDTTFGSGGFTTVGPQNSEVDRVAVSGNKIVAAGRTFPSRREVNTQVLRFFR